MQVSGQYYALAVLLPWKDYGTQWTGTGGWVNPAASLDISETIHFPHQEVNLSHLALAITHTGWAILPYSIDQAIKCITASSRSNYCESKLTKYITLMPKVSCVQAYMWFYNSFLTNFKIHFTNQCSFSKQLTWEINLITHGVIQETWGRNSSHSDRWCNTFWPHYIPNSFLLHTCLTCFRAVLNWQTEIFHRNLTDTYPACIQVF